jgi:hypothetical protein
VLVNEGKLTRASYPPRWNDVIQYTLVVVQEKASIPPWLNDVVRETLVFSYHVLAFPSGGMMLFEMNLCLRRRES